MREFVTCSTYTNNTQEMEQKNNHNKMLMYQK